MENKWWCHLILSISRCIVCGYEFKRSLDCNVNGESVFKNKEFRMIWDEWLVEDILTVILKIGSKRLETNYRMAR